jgi:hypothetical protein
MDEVRTRIESHVRYANITIIEGPGASQYGIGIISARIAEMVLNDERAAIPIGSCHHALGYPLPTKYCRPGRCTDGSTAVPDARGTEQFGKERKKPKERPADSEDVVLGQCDGSLSSSGDPSVGLTLLTLVRCRRSEIGRREGVKC